MSWRINMLRIRLSRVGRKKQPFFKIVVIPKSAAAKSRTFKDEVGTHDPVNKETVIDAEKTRSWIAKGAQPTDTVHNLLVKHGVITGRKKKVHDKDPVEAKKEEKPKEDEEKKETKEEEKEEDEDGDKEEEKEDTDEEKGKQEDEDKEEEKQEKKEEDNDLNSLDLTTRIINSLEDAGIDTVEKLKEKSEDELKEVKGLGPKSIEKIMEVIK